MTEIEKVKISKLIEGANGSRGVLKAVLHRWGDIEINPGWLILNKGELFRRITNGLGNNTHYSGHYREGDVKRRSHQR